MNNSITNSVKKGDQKLEDHKPKSHNHCSWIQLWWFLYNWIDDSGNCTVNLCQNQLEKSSSDANASATKATINIFGRSNLQVSPMYHQRPPKNRTHLKHSKSLTSKNSKLKIQTLWILHQVTKLEAPREKPRKPKLSKSTQMKIQQNYTKNKDFFPLWVSLWQPKKRGWNAHLTPTHYFFYVRILFWNGAAIKDWEKWRCGEVVKEKGEIFTMLLGYSGRIRDSWGRDC